MQLKYNNSIRSKVERQTLMMSLGAALLISLLALAAIFYVKQSTIEISYKLGDSAAENSSEVLEAQAEDMLMSLLESKAAQSSYRMLVIENSVKMMSDNATYIMSNPDEFLKSDIQYPSAENEGILVGQLRLGKGVVQKNVQDEIDLIANSQQMFMYLMTHNESLGSVYLGTENGVSISVDVDSQNKTNVFDPRTRSWYISAKEQNGLIWTDVFNDASGRGLAITCAKPYYDGAGNIAGVVGVGSLLNSLNEIVLGTKIADTGYAFVVNQKGQIIISPHIQTDNVGNIIRENLLENKQLRDVAQKMLDRKAGLEMITLKGENYFFAYTPFTDFPWSMATLVRVDEITKLAEESRQKINDMTTLALGNIDSGILVVLCIFGIFMLIVISVVITFSRRLAGIITQPIIALTEGARIIGGGNLTYELDIKTGDEIETLSETFHKMVEDIQLITGEKERIGAELNVATKIQAGMLPCIFPPFPDRDELDIFGMMIPAKEVGGDFYDFFFVDADRFCVVIADVSGKGVPAALFMVITKTLIKNNALNGKSPKDIFETVNRQLCENNDASMFVTSFLGILELSTGKFEYVNAGHNPPLVKRNGGNFEWLKTQPGFVLAGLERTKYRQYEMDLCEGDTVFLYTDGVTEATNQQNALYSEQKLIDDINLHKDKPLQELLSAIKNEIDCHAGGAEQADDITMLSVKLLKCGKGQMKALTTAASTEHLREVIDFAEAELDKYNCDKKTKRKFNLAIEEIFVNIANYAYQPHTGEATVRIMAENDAILIEFEDMGKPYNPLENADPDISLSAAEREIGGLGIYMVKEMMDEVLYQHKDGKNILTLKKQVEGG